MRVVLILLYVEAAHALPPSMWTEEQAKTICALDVRRLYGDTLAVVSFMGKQPHEDNTTLVGLVASDSRTEYKRQQVVVGCIYKQDGSLFTIFFNSKVANWTAPERVKARPKQAVAPPNRAPVSPNQGYLMSIPSDPKGKHYIIAKAGTRNMPILVTRREGPSGTIYSERLFNCVDHKTKYLGTGATQNEMKASTPESKMGPIVRESIAWYKWIHACAGDNPSTNVWKVELERMSYDERLRILAAQVESSGERCAPMQLAYRGMDDDFTAYYHVMCGRNLDCFVSIEPTETGINSTTSCGVMRLMGASCNVEFPNR